jgi:archaellin
MTLVRTIITILCFGVLSACGGGGGSSSGSGGSSGGSKTFSISTTSVPFELDAGTSYENVNAAEISVKSNKVAYMGAAFSGNAPDWLSVDVVAASNSTFRLALTATAVNKAEGTYTANVLVGSANTDGDILDTVSVRVTMKVNVPLAFGYDTPGFNAVFASSNSKFSSPVHVYAGSNLNWSLKSDQSWLSVGVPASSGSKNVPLDVDTTGLSIGRYQATLTLSNNADSGDTHTKVINLEVTEPSFQLSLSEVILGGELGFERIEKQIAASLNTGRTDYDLSLNFTDINPAYINSNIGTVNDLGYKTITLQAAGMPPGRHEGRVEVTATIKGYIMRKSFDLIVKQEERKLLADYYGIAFSDFPSKSVLARSIMIRANSPGESFSWKASSNQSWLSVSSEGLTGESLQITADPSSLLADQFHEAVVTIAPNDAITQKAISIRVGLWIGSADAPDQNVQYDSYQIETSPVEPWVIGLDSAGTYRIHNIYTGDLVRSFPSVNSTYKDFVISADGRQLIEYTQQELIAYSLADGSETARYPFGNQYNRDLAYISYAMPNGTPTIVTGGGHVINLETGSWQAYEALQTYRDGFITVTPQSDKFYIATYNDTNFYNLKGSTVNATPYLIVHEASESDITNGNDVAVTHDGSRIFAAGGGGAGTPGYQFIYYDAMDLSNKNYINGGAYPNNVETSWSGILATGILGYYDDLDTFIYDANLQPLMEFKCAGATYTETWSNDLRFSGDNTRLVCATRDNGYGHYGIYIHNLNQ